MNITYTQKIILKPTSKDLRIWGFFYASGQLVPYFGPSTARDLAPESVLVLGTYRLLFCLVMLPIASLTVEKDSSHSG